MCCHDSSGRHFLSNKSTSLLKNEMRGLILQKVGTLGLTVGRRGPRSPQANSFGCCGSWIRGRETPSILRFETCPRVSWDFFQCSSWGLSNSTIQWKGGDSWPLAIALLMPNAAFLFSPRTIARHSLPALLVAAV